MATLAEGVVGFSWATAYLVAVWVLRLFMVVVVLRTRRANVALAWLAVVLFDPALGAILYLLIGRVRIDPAMAERYEQLRHASPPPRFDTASLPVNDSLKDLVRLTEGLGCVPPTVGNSIELASTHQDFVNRIVRDIDSAQRTVRLMYYIFWGDATGQRVGAALLAAARRGVDCKVLADAAGSEILFEAYAHDLRAGGVDVRAMLPVRWSRVLRVRADLRNHRKLAVIDDQVSWTGSHNMCDPDYGGSKYGPWIDLSARIKGPCSVQLARVFAEDWYAENGERGELERVDALAPPAPELGGSAMVQTVRSGPAGLTDNLEPLLVGAMHEAEKRIIITAPYLVPTASLVLHLRVAVLRGVRVDIIVPDRSNHPIVHAAGRASFDELLEAGVHVHLHAPGLLHSKTMLVDDAFALIGTANFDVRSLSLNFELNTVVFDKATVEELGAIHESYLASSRQVSLDEWRTRGTLRRIGEGVARLFSPLL